MSCQLHLKLDSLLFLDVITPYLCKPLNFIERMVLAHTSSRDYESYRPGPD